ncbi:17823_t:CDS:1, partial [Gigaspora margarita]
QDNIGHVIIKSSIDGAEQKINLIQHNQLHILKKLPGLSAMQQWYLYKEVKKHIQNPLKQSNYCSIFQISNPKKKV